VRDGSTHPKGLDPAPRFFVKRAHESAGLLDGEIRGGSREWRARGARQGEDDESYVREVAPQIDPRLPNYHCAAGRIAHGACRLALARADEDDDGLARDEPLLALLAAASLRTRIAAGPHRGEPWRRLGDRVDPRGPSEDPDASPRVPAYRGMSLHAAVAVPARDRRRLERLCRYVARPPLANDRLEEHPDGRLLLRLKTRWRDGTTHVLMERSELIDPLVPLIPPPRAHQVRRACARRRSRRTRRDPDARPADGCTNG
jgi:hypothetical protein